MTDEPKYPNPATLSRPERDALIINSLEAIANELARLGKVLEEVRRKI